MTQFQVARKSAQRGYLVAMFVDKYAILVHACLVFVRWISAVDAGGPHVQPYVTRVKRSHRSACGLVKSHSTVGATSAESTVAQGSAKRQSGWP